MKQISIATAWIFGVILFALVFTAGGLSLYINVTVGLQMGLVAAILFGLGDVGVMTLPIVMQAVGKTLFLRSSYALMVFVSIFCAFLATADMFGAQFVKTYTAKKSETVGAQQLAELRLSLTSARTMAADEAKKKSCADRCQALVARVESLEKDIKVQVAKQQAITTQDMSGKALLGEQMFGIAAGKIDTWTTAAIVVFQMALMEVLILMSGIAASLIGLAMRLSAEKKAAKKAAEVAKKIAEEKAAVAAAKKIADAKKKASQARKIAAAAKKIATAEGKDAEAAKKLAAAEKIIAAKRIAQDKKNIAAAQRRAIAAAKKVAAEAKKVIAAEKKAAARKAAAEKKAAREAGRKIVQLVRSQEKEVA